MPSSSMTDEIAAGVHGMLSQKMTTYGYEPEYYIEYTTTVDKSFTDTHPNDKAEMLVNYVTLDSELKGALDLVDYEVSILEQGDVEQIYVQLGYRSKK